MPTPEPSVQDVMNQIREVWRIKDPTLVRELRQSGTLEQLLRVVAQQTLDCARTLREQGGMDRHQALSEAMREVAFSG